MARDATTAKAMVEGKDVTYSNMDSTIVHVQNFAGIKDLDLTANGDIMVLKR